MIPVGARRAILVSALAGLGDLHDARLHPFACFDQKFVSLEAQVEVEFRHERVQLLLVPCMEAGCASFYVGMFVVVGNRPALVLSAALPGGIGVVQDLLSRFLYF